MQVDLTPEEVKFIIGTLVNVTVNLNHEQSEQRNSIINAIEAKLQMAAKPEVKPA